MTDPTRGEIPETVVIPPKQFLEEEALLEVWNDRGMKYRVDELHKFLSDRGLLPTMRKESLRKKVYGMLRQFLCEGEFRRDPRFVPPLKKSLRL